MVDPTSKRAYALRGDGTRAAGAAESADAVPDPREFADAEAWFEALLSGEEGEVFAAALIGRIMDEPLRDDDLQTTNEEVTKAIAQITHRLTHGMKTNQDRTESPCDPLPAVAPPRTGAEPDQWISLGDHRAHFGDEARGPAVSWSIPLSAAMTAPQCQALGWAGDWIHVSQAPTGDGVASYTITVDTRPPAAKEGALRVAVRADDGDGRDVVLTHGTCAQTVAGLPADWQGIRLGFTAEPAPGADPCADSITPGHVAGARSSIDASADSWAPPDTPSPEALKNVLLAHPGVRQAAVLVRGGAAHRQLVACVAAAGATEAALRAHVEAHLPGAAMVAAFVFLQQVPMTHEGTVDYATLDRLVMRAAAAPGAVPMDAGCPLPGFAAGERVDGAPRGRTPPFVLGLGGTGAAVLEHLRGSDRAWIVDAPGTGKTHVWHHLLDLEMDTFSALDGSIRGAALDRAIESLASELRAHGVGDRTPVGVLTRHCSFSVYPLAAVLKVHAAYVPIDPDLDAERIAALLESTAPALVLAEQELVDRLPAGTRVLILDRSPSAEAHPQPSPRTPLDVWNPGGVGNMRDFLARTPERFVPDPFGTHGCPWTAGGDAGLAHQVEHEPVIVDFGTAAVSGEYRRLTEHSYDSMRAVSHICRRLERDLPSPTTFDPSFLADCL
ncbi:MAG TPA: AMP-binding protein, partial [Longimicrobium sp.]|nr:AMP-binding protein [Longimicrobium sp.]